MRALVFIVPIALALWGGWIAGRTKPKSELNRNERKELNTARNLIDDIAVMASESATLGEAGATRILFKITEARKAER